MGPGAARGLEEEEDDDDDDDDSAPSKLDVLPLADGKAPETDTATAKGEATRVTVMSLTMAGPGLRGSSSPGASAAAAAAPAPTSEVGLSHSAPDSNSLIVLYTKRRAHQLAFEVRYNEGESVDSNTAKQKSVKFVVDVAAIYKARDGGGHNSYSNPRHRSPRSSRYRCTCERPRRATIRSSSSTCATRPSATRLGHRRARSAAPPSRPARH